MMAGKFSALWLLACTVCMASFALAEDAARIVELSQSNRDFAAAMLALGDEDAATAIEKLKPLTSSSDRMLAAESTYFLGRAYLLNEQCEEAMPALQRVLSEHAAESSHLAEAQCFLGICQEQLLDRRAALATFRKFLQDHPAAPERMQISAKQRIAALRAIEEGALSDVQTRMEYVGRRLNIGHSGRRTQEEQDNIIAMLDKLMKEDPPQDGPGSPNDKPPSDKPSEPRPGSGKPGPKGGPNGDGPTGGGGAETGDPDHPLSKLARRTGVARGDWNHVRNNDREAKAIEAIKARFPSRYQELVKDYYRSLMDDAE